MTNRRMIPLTDPSEVPANMSEEQAREFWDMHEITEEYLLKAESVPEEPSLPVRPRTYSNYSCSYEEQLQEPKSVNVDKVIGAGDRLAVFGVETCEEMAEDAAIEAQEQNRKFIQIANLLERSLSAHIASFGSALSAYEENRVEEHTKRRIRRSLRYFAKTTQSRHRLSRPSRVIRQPKNRRAKRWGQYR